MCSLNGEPRECCGAMYIISNLGSCVPWDARGSPGSPAGCEKFPWDFPGELGSRGISYETGIPTPTRKVRVPMGCPVGSGNFPWEREFPTEAGYSRSHGTLTLTLALPLTQTPSRGQLPRPRLRRSHESASRGTSRGIFIPPVGSCPVGSLPAGNLSRGKFSLLPWDLPWDCRTSRHNLPRDDHGNFPREEETSRGMS